MRERKQIAIVLGLNSVKLIQLRFIKKANECCYLEL